MGQIWNDDHWPFNWCSGLFIYVEPIYYIAEGIKDPLLQLLITWIT